MDICRVMLTSAKDHNLKRDDHQIYKKRNVMSWHISLISAINYN